MTPEERRERIQRLQARQQIKRDSEKVANLLESLNSMTFLGFLEDTSCPHAGVLYRGIWNLEPTGRLAAEASNAELRKWLLECLDRIGLEDEYYLALSINWWVPWARIRITDRNGWLLDVLERLSTQSLIVLSADRERMLALREEEHWYAAHIQRVSALSLQGEAKD